MLVHGFIDPGNIAKASPIVFLLKKDGSLCSKATIPDLISELYYMITLFRECINLSTLWTTSKVP